MSSEREELAGELYRAYNEGDPQGKVPFLSSEARLHVADALLAAGYRKTPEPEWEYSIAYRDDEHGTLWEVGECEVFPTRGAAQNEFEKHIGGWLETDQLVRRVKAGPWMPVDAETQQDEGAKQ